MAQTTAVEKAPTRARLQKRTKFDIDAEMAEKFGPQKLADELPTVPVGPIFGEEFRLLTNPNVFSGLLVAADPDDSGAITRYLLSLVHPEDRKRFQTTLAQQADLDVERLGYVMQRMLEAVTDPKATDSPRASSRTAKGRASRALSPAK